METIEGLELENQALQSEIEQVKKQLEYERESANSWWKKTQELETKIKILKDLIQII